jgi:hypothetical protein
MEVRVKPFWRRVSLPLALSLSLFAVGCDDDDDNVTTPDTPAPQQPSPAPTADPAPAPAPSPSESPAPPDVAPGDQVVFLGRVKAVDFPTLRVGGQLVQVQEETQYLRDGQPVTLSDIEIGTTVRVKGRLMLDRTTVLADRIVVEK